MSCLVKFDAHKRNKILSLPNDELSMMIDRFIKGEVIRRMLKRRLIDKIRFEPLAEEFNYSVRQTKNIVYKSISVLCEHI